MATAKKPPYFKHLGKDARMKETLHTPLELTRHRNLYLRLCSIIMSQQLSTQVAKVLFKRFLELFDGEPTPEQILSLSDEQLRGVGLSRAKAEYVRNVAAFARDHDVSDEKLGAMSDEEIMDYLLPIKGVGRWTVQMLLMFSLGREDLFAPDDLGIQQAMVKLYGLEGLDKKQLRAKMLELSEPWKPYRTYACLHLWRWKDPV